jgi:hypothetical protein
LEVFGLLGFYFMGWGVGGGLLFVWVEMTHFKMMVLVQIATMTMHLEAMVVIQIVAMTTQFETMENNDNSNCYNKYSL